MLLLKLNKSSGQQYIFLNGSWKTHFVCFSVLVLWSYFPPPCSAVICFTKLGFCFPFLFITGGGFWVDSLSTSPRENKHWGEERRTEWWAITFRAAAGNHSNISIPLRLPVRGTSPRIQGLTQRVLVPLSSALSVLYVFKSDGLEPQRETQWSIHLGNWDKDKGGILVTTWTYSSIHMRYIVCVADDYTPPGFQVNQLV